MGLRQTTYKKGLSLALNRLCEPCTCLLRGHRRPDGIRTEWQLIAAQVACERFRLCNVLHK